MPQPDFTLQDLRASADPTDPRASSLLVPHTQPDGSLEGRPVLVGLPYDGGIPSRPGARFGPRALREALTSFTTFDGEVDLKAGEPLLDLGDLSLPSTDGAETHRRVEDAARRIWAATARPIFIGGDHGLTGSVVRGLAEARPELKLALVSIDAHLDVREYESESRISSGTPFRRALETGVLEGPRTAMIGLRPFANAQRHTDWARERGIFLVSAEAVAARGTAAVVTEALTRIMEGADALYLSVDLDAADAGAAPGTSAGGPGGLTSREMIELVRRFAGEPRLVGVDLMELSPPLDPDGRTARLAARLLLEMLSARQSARS